MILNNDRRTTTLLVGARPVKRFNIDPDGEIEEDGKRIVWTVIFQRWWKEGGGYALADLHEIPRVDFIILLYFKKKNFNVIHDIII